jgi:hypothetical protein
VVEGVGVRGAVAFQELEDRFWLEQDRRAMWENVKISMEAYRVEFGVDFIVAGSRVGQFGYFFEFHGELRRIFAGFQIKIAEKIVCAKR